MKLLVVIMDKYQDIEVNGFLGTLKRAKKFNTITYWNPDGQNEVFGSNEIGSIKTVSNDIDAKDYDAIFIPGGAACIAMRENKRTIDLINEFVKNDKWVFAICDGPNVLVDHNIFANKNYSSFPIENINEVAGINRNKNYVTVDGKYITGKCPSASIDLGLKVIEVLFGSELAQSVHKGIYGIE